jgi:hypothetical protein
LAQAGNEGDDGARSRDRESARVTNVLVLIEVSIGRRHARLAQASTVPPVRQ